MCLLAGPFLQFTGQVDVDICLDRPKSLSHPHSAASTTAQPPGKCIVFSRTAPPPNAPPHLQSTPTSTATCHPRFFHSPSLLTLANTAALRFRRSATHNTSAHPLPPLAIRLRSRPRRYKRSILARWCFLLSSGASAFDLVGPIGRSRSRYFAVKSNFASTGLVLWHSPSRPLHRPLRAC